MTDATTPDLDAIKARADAATKGPWETVPTVGNAVVSADGDGYWTDVADRIEVEEDAIFIAEARTDVPALLAEVKRLTEVNSRLARKIMRGYHA